MEANRPNILYIHSHDTGRYVQPYGYAIPTPRIQQLAEEGVLFRKAFCVGPTCSPSRAALLTGQCPHSAGMVGLAHRGFSLSDYGQHIIHALRAAGYYSALVGVQHVAAEAGTIGYDHVAAQKDDLAAKADPKDPEYRARTIVAAAEEFLAAPPDRPFFLSVGFFETHRVFQPVGQAEDARYCRPAAPIADMPETRADMAGFMSSARVLDRSIGQVLEALDRAGLAGNTLVICTADHGTAFPGMKCTLTDHGTGVMLMMRGPGEFTGGKVCDAMVTHMDIFPTICELLHIDRPEWLEGDSLMPLIRGETDEIHDEIHSEINYHACYDPHRAVRTRRWKYIRRFGDRARPLLPNLDDGPSKNLWLSHGWSERDLPEEYLFDLVFDPNEAANLADQPRCGQVLADMRERLDHWMKETDDPLLKGPVPAPSGAKVNDPDAVSPNEPTITVP